MRINMNSLRRWLYRPKRSDPSLLAQFYFADEELNLIATELDGLEGRKDPERCAMLVTQLRTSQARVLNIVSQIMDESIKDRRALRDFRVKFPDDVIQENLSGQLWFGAECLAAGSSIMNREVESAFMRPLARALTKSLDSLRTILREQCLRNVEEYTEYIRENLVIFDKLFAEFELSYVSAMVSVKTAHEYDMIQEITVLFSETVQRALKIGLLTQEMIDEYDPALMFTIPRLAIVSGVLLFKDGPLNPDNEPWNISEMFRPFQTLLIKIRELLSILTAEELNTLERALCSQEEPSFLVSLDEKKKMAREEKRRLKREKKLNTNLKKDRKTSDGDNGSIESELTAMEIAERLEALASNFEATHMASPLVYSVTSHRQSDETNSDESPTPLKEKQAPVRNHSYNHFGSDLAVHLGRAEDFYTEANLDSSELFNAPSRAFPQELMDGLIVQGMRMATNFVHNNSESPVPNDHINVVNSQTISSFTGANDNGENLASAHEPCENLEEDGLLHDKSKFSLNKCDSSDSGLQSEVVSNSGSMFTISSSDSNQQILTSDSIPTPSDQNATDSNEEVETQNSSHSSDPDNCRTLEHSSDSSATIISTSTNESGKQSLNPVECAGEKLDSSESGDCDEKLSPDVAKQMESSDSSLQCDHSVSNEAYNVENTEDFCCDKAKDFVSSEETTSVNYSKHSDGDSCDKCSSNEVVVEGGENVKAKEMDVNECNSSSCDNVKDSFDTVKEDTGDNSIPNTMDLVQSENDPQTSCEESQIISQDALSNKGASSSQPCNVESSILSDSAEHALEAAGAADAPHSSQSSASAAAASCSHTESDKKASASKSHHSKGASGAKSKSSGKKKGKSSRRQDSAVHRSRDQKASATAIRNKFVLDCHHQLETDRLYHSSETSSYTSECGDEEEIALAITASRNNVRARFKSSSDMIHRLFVCISGVADQLQTNFAGDLRNILRSVFDMNCPDPAEASENEKAKDNTPLGAAYRAISHASRTPRHRHSSLRRDPPIWLPDEQTSECMACTVPFNFLRRRHHCRNCGKIFCSHCSSNFVPLPHFGQDKAVRVCNRCFMFQVTPFTE